MQREEKSEGGTCSKEKREEGRQLIKSTCNYTTRARREEKAGRLRNN